MKKAKIWISTEGICSVVTSNNWLCILQDSTTFADIENIIELRYTINAVLQKF